MEGWSFNIPVTFTDLTQAPDLKHLGCLNKLRNALLLYHDLTMVNKVQDCHQFSISYISEDDYGMLAWIFLQDHNQIEKQEQGNKLVEWVGYLQQPPEIRWTGWEDHFMSLEAALIAGQGDINKVLLAKKDFKFWHNTLWVVVPPQAVLLCCTLWFAHACSSSGSTSSSSSSSREAALSFATDERRLRTSFCCTAVAKGLPWVKKKEGQGAWVTSGDWQTAAAETGDTWLCSGRKIQHECGFSWCCWRWWSYCWSPEFNSWPRPWPRFGCGCSEA